MTPPGPDRAGAAPRLGRVVALWPAARPPAVGLYHRERYLRLAATPAQVRALAVGDLVAFTAAEGGHRLAHLERLGGPQPGAWRDSGDALRWRRGGGGQSRMALLERRHRIVQAVRGWLDGEGFIEAETPALVPAPSPEPQFAPFAVEAAPGRRDWLATSPEFQLKRMLVGGFERVYRLGPVFRGGEQGRLHNPEFTLLEWYRAGAGVEAMARDLEALLARLAPLADAGGRLRVPAAGGQPEAGVSLRPPFERATVADVLARHLGMEARRLTTGADLRAAARAAGVAEAEALPADFAGAFFRLWQGIEPRLGLERPLLVERWPAPLASLARLAPDDPAVAERLELYAGGIELANGFGELTDPAEQRRRFEADRAERRAQGLPQVPLDEAFLEALAQGMPPAAGMALGVDRLAMLLTGAPTVADVLPFGWDER